MDSSTAAAGAAYADTSQNSQISLGILEDKDDGECLGESQESFTQQMTQTNELTQLFHDDDESNIECNSPTPADPLTIPWGRLMQQNNHTAALDMTPRSPPGTGSITRSKSPSIERGRSPSPVTVTFLGLRNLSPSDRFNEYVLGRSAKADITAEKLTSPNDKQKQKQHDYAHSSISNRHCRIFCLLSSTRGSSGQPEMEVYIEDDSGNGTLINNTTLLRKNDRRKLHTGDVICLVNPMMIGKKIPSMSERKVYMGQYSYVFVNLYEQEARQGWGRGSMQSTSPRRGAVNVRATKCHSAKHTSSGSKRDIFKSQEKPDVKKNTSLGAFLNDPSNPPSKHRRVEEEYDLRELLGTGTCGEVRRAIHRRSGNERAVKIISISNRANRGAGHFSKEKLAAIQAEAEILRSLDHPYIVQLFDVFISPGKAIYLVMELLKGGDLFDRIVDRERYSEIQARRLMRRILAAVYYLHEERGIVHRDIKPENILMCNKRSDVDVKITDFGVAKSMTAEGLKTFCGTPQYFAPEVLRRCNTVKGAGRYGKEIDCWSIGVTLFILLSGSPPYDVSSGFAAVENAHVMFYEDQWKDVSSEARDLVTRLLEKDPSKRMSVKDACEHAWVLIDDGDSHSHPLMDPLVARKHSETNASASEPSKPPKQEEATSHSEAKPSTSEPPKPTEQEATTHFDDLTSGDTTNTDCQSMLSTVEPPQTSADAAATDQHPTTTNNLKLEPLNSSVKPNTPTKKDNQVNEQKENRHLSIMPYESGKSVTKAIQTIDVSLKSPNPGSPIQRKKLFNMKDAVPHETVRKISKANADSIKAAGVSLPKPVLQSMSQNQSPKKKKEKGISSYFPLAPVHSKKPESQSSQSAVPNTSTDEKKRKMEEEQPPAEQLVFSLKKKMKVDTKHRNSSISPESREDNNLPPTSKTELSEDELVSDFSDNEDFETNAGGTKAIQLNPLIPKSHQQLIAKNKVSIITSKETRTQPESKRFTQSFLFGKPPPGVRAMQNSADDAGPVHNVYESDGPKALSSESQADEPIELQQSPPTKLKSIAAKGNQRSIKSWFAPK